MAKKQNEQASVTVSLQDDIIHMRIVGKITTRQLSVAGNRSVEMGKQLKAQGKKILILTDARKAKIGSSELRMESKKLLTNPFDASATYGNNIIAPMAMYLMRGVTRGKNIRYFRSRSEAVRWLRNINRPVEQARDRLGLYLALATAIVGVLALIGWEFNNSYLMRVHPQLRPINPMAAVGLLILAAGVLGLWSGKVLLARLAAALSVIIGALSLLPGEILDNLLFSEKVALSGTHNELGDTAAICFIFLGVALFALTCIGTGKLAVGYARFWKRLAIGSALIAFLVGQVVLFGFLYVREAAYDISPTFVMAIHLAAAFILLSAGMLAMSIWRRPLDRLREVSNITWVILLVLCIVQVLAIALWHVSRNQLETTSYQRFSIEAEDARRNLSSRMQSYTDVLYGFRGLFHSSDSVSHGEFVGYFESLDVAKKYPGFYAIGFIEYLPQGQEASYQAKTRADTSYHPNGRPGFTLNNLYNGDHYISNYSVRGVDGTVSTGGGLDLASNKTRRQAYDKARDTGQPTAINKIQILNSDGTASNRQGFVLALPVYQSSTPDTTAERRKHLTGFVNAVFYYDVLLEEVFSSTVDRGLSIELSTRNSRGISERFYASGNTRLFSLSPNKRQIESDNVQVGDSLWRFVAAAPGNYSITGVRAYTPYITILLGGLLSALLIAAFWNLSQLRRQAVELAAGMTEDLENERNEAIALQSQDEAILSSIGDGVFALDMKERIILFNKAASEIAGILPQKAMGKLYTDVLHFANEHDGKVNNKFVQQALVGKRSAMSKHTVLVRTDGVQVPVADSAAPIIDSNGKQIGIIVVFRDVSEERKIEQAKDEFVSLTSHQLRTPLTAIRLFIEMMLKGQVGPLTAPQRDYIEKIDISTKRMIRLVGDFLNVSRIELGRFKVEPSATDLAALVQSHVVELEPVARRKGIALSFTPPKSAISSLPIDQNLYGQVVHNLLTNAIRYSPAKTGRIDVRLQKTDEGIELTVADNGIGIPSESQSKIFARFYRAANAVKVETEGSGLGLYLVKQIVLAIGGKIWFESAADKGTTFHAIIPASGMKSKAGEVSLTKTGSDL